MTEINGVILAGGKATRMMGMDKGLVLLNGRPLIQHVIDRFKPQVNKLVINANRHKDQYAGFGFPVVADHNSDFSGPLSGMLAGLKISQTEYTAFVPCDAPLLPTGLVSQLHQSIITSGSHIAVVFDGEWMQPLFIVIHKNMTEQLEADINSGQRKVNQWIKQNRHISVDFSKEMNAFTNLNTLDSINTFPRD
jgi:molybdopterin-guanine dinucleotide biosynthesis protein A